MPSSMKPSGVNATMFVKLVRIKSRSSAPSIESMTIWGSIEILPTDAFMEERIRNLTPS